MFRELEFHGKQCKNPASGGIYGQVTGKKPSWWKKKISEKVLTLKRKRPKRVIKGALFDRLSASSLSAYKGKRELLRGGERAFLFVPLKSGLYREPRRKKPPLNRANKKSGKGDTFGMRSQMWKKKGGENAFVYNRCNTKRGNHIRRLLGESRLEHAMPKRKAVRKKKFSLTSTLMAQNRAIMFKKPEDNERREGASL